MRKEMPQESKVMLYLSTSVARLNFITQGVFTTPGCGLVNRVKAPAAFRFSLRRKKKTIHIPLSHQQYERHILTDD
jgi:hypothetical protein